MKQSFGPAASERVQVIPFVPRSEMLGIYAQHDIFIFPSLMGGLPIVLLEAMAAGMPVVTTETCGMMDIIEDEYSGLLVKPADTADFASAVERLMTSAELRQRLAQNAQTTIWRHSWERTAEQLDEVLHLAVAERRS